MTNFLSPTKFVDWEWIDGVEERHSKGSKPCEELEDEQEHQRPRICNASELHAAPRIVHVAAHAHPLLVQ